MAKILNDEEKIYIPSLQEAKNIPSPNPYKVAQTSTVNQKPSLNKSTEEQLVAVNGIGPATAKLIISWRTQNGPFKVIEDLGKIPGIGAKTLAKILPQVSL